MMYGNHPLYRIVIRHPLTDVTILARCRSGNPVLAAVFFGVREVSAGGAFIPLSTHPSLQRFARLIADFLDGKRRDLAMIPIDTSDRTPFCRKVLLTARKIPWGAAVSYAALAERAGRPKAIRASASVMRNNPFPLVVPCHRVIRSDGSIGGFMGKRSGREVELKKRLLERER